MRMSCLGAGLFMLLATAPVLAECETPTGTAAKTVSRLYAAIDGNQEGACVLYGDYSGDGKKDALVFLYFSPEGGNGIFLEVHKLKNVKRQFKPDGQVDVVGIEPRDARFAKGRIEVTTTVQGPDDPRCCPSETKTWVIDAR